MFENRKKTTTLENAALISQTSMKNIPRAAQKDDEYAGSGLPPIVTNVMAKVKFKWEFMTSQEFNPIPHALGLFEERSTMYSLGLNYDTFCQVFIELEQAMDVIVNDYHQSFNGAIHTFSSVVETISQSKAQVTGMKSSLQTSKDWFACKRYDLLHLWIKSLQYKEMGRVLDQVHDLAQTPDKLSNLINGKYFLACVKTLLSSLALIEGECAEIGALETVKQQLYTIKNTLFERLLDELNNHLYIKIRSDARPEEIPDLNAEFEEDPDIPPTSNSFVYIRSIIESLFLLGKLKDALEIIRERIALELFQVVDYVIQEIDAKYKNSSSIEDTSISIAYTSPVFGSVSNETEMVILKDLLSEIYSRFEMITQRHQYTINIVENISQRKGDEDLKYHYSMDDVKLYLQNEIKSLLFEYLTNADNVTAINSNILSIKEVIKDKKQKSSAPEKMKKLIFHINTHSRKKSYTIKTYGSIDPKIELPTISNSSYQSNADGSIRSGGSVGHRLLIQPHAHNILVAYGPTMSFISKIDCHRSSNFGEFLNDFLLTALLPQIDSRVEDYLQMYIHGIDAFQDQTFSMLSSYPLMKSVVAVLILIKGMASSIDAIPAHREDFIKMIENVISIYYESCQVKLKALYSQDQEEHENGKVISSIWAEHNEITTCLFQNPFFVTWMDVQEETQSQLIKKEIELEMNLKKDRSLHRTEIIIDLKKIQSISNMTHSLQWLRMQIAQMINVKKEGDDSIPGQNTATIHQANQSVKNDELFMDSLTDLLLSDNQFLGLDLTSDIVLRFNESLKRFKKLEENAFFVLRLEVRVHVMYYLDLAIIEGNYYLEDANSEPDPYIGLLNQDLIMMEEIITISLSPRRAKFVFEGLARTMSYLLCFNIGRIKRLNKTGVQKLIRNVKSLQQSLTNIGSVNDRQELDIAIAYYELLLVDGPTMMRAIESHPSRFTYEELKRLLDLKFIDVSDNNRTEYVGILKKIKDHFISLNL